MASSLRSASIFLGALAATEAVAPTASATLHYPSPTGSGTACTSVAPCHIVQAIDGANASDDVIVGPGDYTLLATLPVANQITIRGVAGRPRPRLRFEGNQSGLYVPHGTVVRHIAIEQAASSTPFAIAPGTQAKVRVRVSRSGRALLRSARRVRGRAANIARSDAGELKTTVTAVTIRRRG